MRNNFCVLFFLLIFTFVHAEKNLQSDMISVLPPGLSEKDIRNWTMDDDENFYFVSEKDGKYYISENRKEIGPLEICPYIVVVSDYGLVYEIRENEKIFYLIGDKKIGPFDSVYFGIGFSKNYNHYYISSKIEEDFFIVTDTQSFGPFKRNPAFIEINNDGSVCYAVRNNLKTEIFIDSKKIDEAFDTDSFFCRTDSFFYAKKDEKPGNCSFYYDGKLSGLYEKIILLHLGEEPLWLCQEKGKNAVLMRGDKKCSDLPFNIFNIGYSMKEKRIKNYCLLSCYDDENKFICLFDKEQLISYSYMFEKDGKKFVSFNDKQYGPYDNVHFIGITEDSVFWTVSVWSEVEVPDEKLSYAEVSDTEVAAGPAGVDGISPFSYSRPNYGERHDLSVYKNGIILKEYKTFYDYYIDDLIANKKGDYVFEYNFNNLCVNGKVYAFDDDIFFLQDFVNETSDLIAMTILDSYTGYSLWKNNKFYKAILSDDSIIYVDGNVIRKIKLN